jgi:Tol biopolymer transport system component
LTYNPVVDWGPSWSPDGKKIIFSRVRNNENDSEIYIMNADGSDQKKITNNSVYDGHPAWSPFLKTEE